MTETPTPKAITVLATPAMQLQYAVMTAMLALTTDVIRLPENASMKITQHLVMTETPAPKAILVLAGPAKELQ